MDRKEAISRIGLLLGGTVVGSGIFIQTGCTSTSEQVNEIFNQDQVILLNEIGETILPATDTPGAKAADVGGFMAIVVKDCYSMDEREIFLNGIDELNKACIQKNDKEFMKCNYSQRKNILSSLDAEQEIYMANKKKEDPNHYFRMMKELTLLGFFTSETGATKTLRYLKVPTTYKGCISYKKGDRAWY